MHHCYGDLSVLLLAVQSGNDCEGDQFEGPNQLTACM